MKLSISIITALVVTLIATPCYPKKSKEQLIDSLTGELSSVASDTGRISILDKLSYLSSQSNANIGLIYANKALALSQKSGWERGMALAYIDQSINYQAKSDLGPALTCATAALNKFKKINDTDGVAASEANIAAIYVTQAKYAKALSYLFEALKKYEQRNDLLHLSIVQENIGTIYKYQNNYTKALVYYQSAEKINKGLGLADAIARNAGNIGTILDASGKYDSALIFHKIALEVNQKIGNKQSSQVNLANIGYVLYHKGNLAEALKYQKEALALSEELNNISSKAIDIGNMGETYMAMAVGAGRGLPITRSEAMVQAIGHLKEAITICKRINFPGPEMEYLTHLAECYKQTGNYKAALDAQTSYYVLKDSVFSKENEVHIANLEANRELAIRNKDIKIKNHELHIKNLEIRQNKTEITLYILLLVLSALIIWYFIRITVQYRRKTKALEVAKNDAERRLVNNEYRLKQAQHIAHFGNWILDLSTGVGLWSEELCAIYEIPTQNRRQSFSSWLTFIHPDDKERVIALTKEAQNSLTDTSFFHRIITGKGNVKHIHSMAVFEFDADGKPSGLYGVAHDTTEMLKQSEMIEKQNTALGEIAWIQSHIIRAPLASLLGLLDLLQHRVEYGLDEKELLEMTMAAAKKLDDVIHQVVDKTHGK